MNDDIEKKNKVSAYLEVANKVEKGKLTIFIGAAPGVGKTYAMLNAAAELTQTEKYVLLGVIETHGRKDTEHVAQPLPHLPKKKFLYKETQLEEFDLDAAIDERPDVILVDELAHTNAPGSRHSKRYEDIMELLDQGIDVFTTVNVQHLVSFNDIVRRITGVNVTETVPDSILDKAYDIRFIDLPPEALIDRMNQGKIYLPEYARLAKNTFFSVSNLIALRELAIKRVLNKVDGELVNSAKAKSGQLNIVINDKLLVLIDNNRDHRYLVSLGRKIAERRKISWVVVWVDTGDVQNDKSRKNLNGALDLTKELGGEVDIIRGEDPITSVAPYIAENRINTVLLGAGKRKWYQPFKKKMYRRLIDSELDIEVCVYNPPKGLKKDKQNFNISSDFIGDKKGHIFGVIGVVCASFISIYLESFISNGNIVFIYVFLIIMVGTKFGARPAINTAFWSFLSFNFFLTEPKLTLNVYSQDDIATLIFLVVIGFVSGPAASKIRNQFLLLKEANRYAETLRDLAQSLSIIKDEKSLWHTLSHHVSLLTNVKCEIYTNHGNGSGGFLKEGTFSLTPVERSALDWSVKNARQSGKFTKTLSSSNYTFIPLVVEESVAAVVIIIWEKEDEYFSAFDNDVIYSMLKQASDTLQRIRLAKDLERSKLHAEVEQLRSTLLSSVSHDLKSPLSAMMGAAEILRELDEKLTLQDRFELVDTIIQESSRLDNYIQNLLDITKFSDKGVKIEKDWVSIDDIISSVLKRLYRFFKGSKVKYEKEGEGSLLYVQTELIEQAIYNIVENASRYTPDNDYVSIRVKFNDRYCLVSIEDNGPGIPEQHLKYIFDMFYVIADSDKKSQSTGMGLAICKSMIEAHGGRIVAANKVTTTGMRFDIMLPINETESEEQLMALKHTVVENDV